MSNANLCSILSHSASKADGAPSTDEKDSSFWPGTTAGDTEVWITQVYDTCG